MRWWITAAAFRWTITPGNSGITGSLSSARCTRGASMTTTAETMNSPWASTVWASAPPSMPPSLWRWRFSGTASGLPSPSKRAKTWAGCTRSPFSIRPPAAVSAGGRTWTCLPKLTSPGNTLKM